MSRSAIQKKQNVYTIVNIRPKTNTDFIHLESIQQDINSSVSVVVLKEQGIFSELTHRALSNSIFSHLKLCLATATHNFKSLKMYVIF